MGEERRSLARRLFYVTSGRRNSTDTLLLLGVWELRPGVDLLFVLAVFAVCIPLTRQLAASGLVFRVFPIFTSAKKNDIHY